MAKKYDGCFKLIRLGLLKSRRKAKLFRDDNRINSMMNEARG